jgi:hypothetical protein
MPDFTLTSTAFEHEGEIPQRHTCDGEDLSPPLTWTDPPDGVESLALVMDDPDAPSGLFVHWLVWGLDPQAGTLPENANGLLEGTNGFGKVGYGGPCPPPGHGRHRYFFRLHALKQALDLEPGASREDLDREIDRHEVAVAHLMGTYERA